MAASSVASPFSRWLADNKPVLDKFRKKRAWALILLATGVAGVIGAAVRGKSSADRRERALMAAEQGERKNQRIAVDFRFLTRLSKILRIIVPSPVCVETLCLAILTALLVARTVVSVAIAEILGQNAQMLVAKKWKSFGKGVLMFALITLPASAINSGLKYFKEVLVVRFRLRLSQYVHNEYLKGVNFYKAINLGSEKIDNADQRVTSDIKKFSSAIADLYTSLFKPVLDVILFTLKLIQNTGWQGPAMMYSYFVLSGVVKRVIMPSFGKMVAQESTLEGEFRTAHQRLITNSEEIAFYDGSAREKDIINNCLNNIYRHVLYVRYLRALVLIFDGLLVKYWASIAGYCVLAAPMVFNVKNAAFKTAEENTRDYIRNSQYLQQLSTAVGQLVLVGNSLTTIAGYTSRVSELVEMVKQLSEVGNKPFAVVEEKSNPAPVDEKEKDTVSPSLNSSDELNWITGWAKRADSQRDARHARRYASASAPVVGGGKIELADFIKFEHVDIVSPEGKLLVKDLNFEVRPGQNVMITGPNGAGKSSLFRIIGELWPLSNGRVVKPRKEDILFVPQKPYLVLGTLRDQIIYPHSYADMRALGITDDDLGHLLGLVDPARIITNTWKWDEVKDWFHAFSGGQKQRVAMARLFYHKPQFAILDECTSAVSDEVEDRLYLTCKQMGITLFTVSHRKALAKHHDFILNFDGRGGWDIRPASEVGAMLVPQSQPPK